MYDITVQSYNLNKSPNPYSQIYSSKKYLWLKDPFVNSNKKHPKEEAAGLILATAYLLMLSKGIQKNLKKIFIILPAEKLIHLFINQKALITSSHSKIFCL